MKIAPASSAEHVEIARRLFREYAEHIRVDLCFQGFERELAELPGAYGPPKGVLLLAWIDDAAIGCVGLRPCQSGTCEMKRLYVQPDRQGSGAGRALAERVIAEAVRLGYRAMVLDTLPVMESAIALYASLGFERRDPYYETPLKDTVFMEKTL
jgi:ribosomal protein S18 acetylase RimI-like enzyme